MEVPSHVYAWLVSLELASKAKQTPEGSYILDQATSKDFENGQRLAPVIRHLYEALNRTPPPQSNLDSLKKVTGLAAKAYNWKVIGEELEPLGVSVSQQAKQSVISGNVSVVADILQAIFDLEKESAQSRLTNTVSKLSTIAEEETDLKNTETCQRFIIASLCQALNVRPNQVVGLLADNAKFLAKIINKGLKGNLDPVVSWTQIVYGNIDVLMNLLVGDTEGFEPTFRILQLGLNSRSLEVVQWSCRILSRLGIECAYSGLSANAWQWFTSPQGGLDQTMLAVQRNSNDVLPLAIELILNFSQSSLVELFTLHLRNFLQDTKDYLSFISEMLPYLNDMRSNSEEIFLAGVVGYWAELAMREAELDSRRGSSAKLLAMVLIVELWKEFYAGREGDILVNPVLNLMSRAAREEQLCVKASAIALLFDCLEYLASNRNPHSKSFYKALTFVLLENYNVRPLREMILVNLKGILAKFPAMPTYVLVEPLVKQLHLNDGAFSVTEFDFISALSRHESLTADQAVVLADALAKVLISDTVHGRAAKGILSSLSERMIAQPSMVQFLQKLLAFSLKSICTDDVYRAKKLHRTSMGDLKEAAGLQAKQQTKKFVLDFVLGLLDLMNGDLNQQIQAMLIEGVNGFRQQTGKDYKAFLVVLEWFGDSIPESQIALYTEPAADSNEDPRYVPLNESLKNYTTGLREDRPQNDIRLRQTRNDFPWERAHNDVQKARQKHLDIVKKRNEEEERNRLRLDFSKKKVKRVLELRKFEQGLKRTDLNTIIRYGEVSTQPVSEEIELREFTSEEADDDEQVKLVLCKYNRVFKSLFSTYSGTGFVRKNELVSDFEWLADRKTKIAESEFLKMLKEHGVVPDFLTKEQLGTIIKIWSQKQKKAEITNLDYEGFRAVFCQLAYFIFSKEPRDFSHMPPVFAIKMLIEAMRSYLISQKKSTALYDEPDPGAGDKDLIQQLNIRMAVNPEMELPEGYIRVTERDVEVYYAVPSQVPIEEPKAICLELLDEIFCTALSLHILEPLVKIVSYDRAKGLRPKKSKIELPPIYERTNEVLKQRLKDASNRKASPEMKVGRSVKLGSVLKYEISQASPDDKQLYTEVAELLEDMLHSLNLGQKSIVTRGRKADNPINRMREEEARREQEEQEKEKQRHIEKTKALKEHLQRMKAEKEAQQKAEEALTEQQRAEIEAKKAAREELIKKKRAERNAQIVENRRKREAELKQKLEEESIKTPKVTAEVKKKHKIKLQEQLKVVQDRFKKSQEIRTKFLKRDVDILARTRKNRPEIIKKERENREEDERRRAELQEFIDSSVAHAVIDQYSDVVDAVFSFYCRQSQAKLEYGEDICFNYMQGPDFYKFAKHFNIVHSLISADKVNRIFKVVTRGKVMKPGLPPMLSKDAFKEGLIRIAAEGKNKLNSINGLGVDELLENDTLSATTIENLCDWLGFDQGLTSIQARLKLHLEQGGSVRDNKTRFQKSSSTPSLGLRAVKQPRLELLPKLSTPSVKEEPGDDLQADFD